MRIAWVVLVLAVLVGGAAYWTLSTYLDTPVGGNAVTTMAVKRGMTLHPLLDDLSTRGVLAHPTWLYVYARLRQPGQLHSGNYEVHANQSPREILAMFMEGRVQLEAFTMAEGLNRWKVRAMLEKDGWMTAAQFDALCDNPKFLADNHVAGPTCEGYLFPETYKFARGVPPNAILATMFAAFRRQLAEVMAQGKGPLNLGERQFTTLASIVEKETGAPAERPHIACIFYNRLRAKPPWRLETDPTVIYAATLADPDFDGNITRAHLHNLDNPYNTYRVYGLPPGPIANPGRASLEAVAQPSACSDFFFVSSNDGQHIFCPNLGCHNKAVKKWQVDYFSQRRTH